MTSSNGGFHQDEHEEEKAEDNGRPPGVDTTRKIQYRRNTTPFTLMPNQCENKQESANQNNSNSSECLLF